MYEVRERTSGRKFSNALELHTLELPRLVARDTAREEPLARWVRFLTTSDPEELERLTMADPLIRKAEERLETFSADPATRQLAADRERGLVMYHHTLAVEHRRGREEGRAEGREEGERRALETVLVARFGPLGDAQRGLLDGASSEQLRAWLVAAATAPSLDEALGANRDE